MPRAGWVVGMHCVLREWLLEPGIHVSGILASLLLLSNPAQVTKPLQASVSSSVKWAQGQEQLHRVSK